MKEINIQKVEQVDDVMVATIAVMDGTTEVFGRTLRARSKAELDGTLGNLLSEVNRIPDEIAKVTIGKWTPPQVEEKSAEQKAFNELLQAREEFSLRLITQTEFDEKVTAYKKAKQTLIK